MMRTVTIIAALLIGGPAAAMPQSLERQATGKLHKEVVRHLAEPGARVRVSDIRLTPHGLDSKIRRIDSLELSHPSRPYGRVSARVRLSLKDGQRVSGYVSAMVSAEVPVWVATRSVRRGEPVGHDAVVIEQRDLARLMRGTLRATDSVDELVATRDLRAGQALSASLVTTPEMVRRGDSVSVTVQVGNVFVRAEGEALRSGRRGQRIPVRVGASRRVMTATIEGPRKVRMER